MTKWPVATGLVMEILWFSLWFSNEFLLSVFLNTQGVYNNLGHTVILKTTHCTIQFNIQIQSRLMVKWTLFFVPPLFICFLVYLFKEFIFHTTWILWVWVAYNKLNRKKYHFWLDSQPDVLTGCGIFAHLSNPSQGPGIGGGCCLIMLKILS